MPHYIDHLPLNIKAISGLCVLPLGDGIFKREIANCVELLCKNLSAQVHMTSEAVPQLVLHECHCRKTLFIFHKPKYLNTCNFNKHHKFQELVLEDEKKLILVQSLMTRFIRDFSLMICSLFVAIIILK